MGNFLDLTGKTFSRLTVIRRVENKGREAGWLCLCECGNYTSVGSQTLRNSLTRSCGCLHREIAREVRKTHGGASGEKYHPLYATWTGMNARCYSPSAPKFPNYGGRGISVCDRWRGVDGFANFLIDMRPRPKGTSIDRLDNDGNYSPDNCRWATPTQQSNNTRKTTLLTIDGITKTLADWANESGVKPATISQRVKRDGKSHKEAVFGHIRYW